MPREWKPAKKWNPFNSAKLMAHVDRWSEIKEGHAAPPPVLVTIDPTNKCNLNCVWCNAKEVRKNNGEMSAQILGELVFYLSRWGVKAVCIAGGGEPTQSQDFSDLIDWLQIEEVRIGIVTNGTAIDDNQQMLLFCDWVGVSIDAGKSATYKAGKGVDRFYDVLKQSKRLIDMARGLNRPLSRPGLGNGVFYKFLVHPSNVMDMWRATITAKHLGFKGIHFRPAGTTWQDQDSDWQVKFNDEQLRCFNVKLKSQCNTMMRTFLSMASSTNSPVNLSRCITSTNAELCL
jgi:pyruvate-formate lyase-activating enzyme